MNFRNSDYVTARMDYVESCFLLWSKFFVELRVLNEYRSISMLTGKFLHEHFVPPQKVASLSQQGRIAAAQRACEVFSIE